MWKSYIEFMQKLALYDAWKIKKSQLRDSDISFLKKYKLYKEAFNNLVQINKVTLKWVKIKNYIIKKCNTKVSKAFALLDSLIVKHVKKSNLTQEQVKALFENYNHFKLAVIKYMKSVNKTEGKKLAKQYVKNMLPLLK